MNKREQIIKIGLKLIVKNYQNKVLINLQTTDLEEAFILFFIFFIKKINSKIKEIKKIKNIIKINNKCIKLIYFLFLSIILL